MKKIFISAAVAALIKAADEPSTDNTDEVKDNLDDPKFKDFKANWQDAQKAMDDAVQAMAKEQAKVDTANASNADIVKADEDAKAAVAAYLTYKADDKCAEDQVCADITCTQKISAQTNAAAALITALGPQDADPIDEDSTCYIKTGADTLDETAYNDLSDTDKTGYAADGACYQKGTEPVIGKTAYDALATGKTDYKKVTVSVPQTKDPVVGDLSDDDKAKHDAFTACATALGTFAGTLKADDLTPLTTAATDAATALDEMETKDLDTAITGEYDTQTGADTGLAASDTAAANLKTRLVAKENLFLMSHVTILAGATADDAEVQSASAKWGTYNDKLVAQQAIWTALVAADTGETGTEEEKTAGKARNAAYALGEKAITDWSKWVKETGDKKELAEGDDTKVADVPKAVDFDVKRTQYQEDYLGALLALSKQLASEETDETTKTALDLYAEFMGVEKDAATTRLEAAQAAAEGGGMGWLWGLLAGVGALVGGYFAYKKCKGGDEKEE